MKYRCKNLHLLSFDGTLFAFPKLDGKSGDWTNSCSQFVHNIELIGIGLRSILSKQAFTSTDWRQSMTTFVATFMFSTFAGILAPFRRAQAPRVLKQPTTPAVMDAATYAAMVAEAERIATPYRQHIAALQQPLLAEPESDFSEVEALLARAGLLSN
jgi:hypothetical protein